MPAALVGGRIHDVGIARIEVHFGHAGVGRSLEGLLPGRAAIARDVEAAFAARGPQRSLRGHPDHVRVARIDHDHRDVLGGLQAHVGPGGAAIERLVDAVAVGNAALGVVLAAADPDHQRVVRIEGHAAERVGTLVVEDRIPGRAGVGRLPEAACGCGDVPDRLVLRIDREVGDAAGDHGRTDSAQGEAAEGFRLHRPACRFSGRLARMQKRRREQDRKQRRHGEFRPQPE